MYFFLAVLGPHCCMGVSLQLRQAGAPLQVWCAAFSLWWTRILWSRGSSVCGRSSWDSQALEYRLSRSGARA